MKTRALFLLVPLLICAPVFVSAEEAQPVKAEQPAVKAEQPSVKAADEPKLDADTVEKLMQDLLAAMQQKGSFWRNPALFDLVFTLVMLIIGALAAKYGWDKKKWWMIIKAVEKAVNTVYVEFIREAKLKNKEAGGKLSKEDMQKALEMAWKLTKDDLAQQGIDLAKWITREYFPVVVDKVIKAVKKG